MMKMLVTAEDVIHTGNLIEEKNKAFLCYICER